MNALSVSHLTKVYANGVVALKDISLEVKQGDFFALLGENGAGKSTTIGIVCSLVKKSAGKVRIFEHCLDSEPAQAKALIGVVPQEINFSTFDRVDSILINQAGYYGIPKRVAGIRMEKYLHKLGIWEKREKQGLHLSGGMKRRLMIARALMNEPRLLILDEPTAGVDIELRHTLWRFLAELNQQGTTIILTTHYLEEAEQLCKNVAIIDQGEIIENTAMKSLINRTNKQTILLDLEKPLTYPPLLKDFKAHLIDETTLEVEVSRGQSINELFHLLSQQHISIYTLRNKTNRLEELFIHLVSENKNL